METIAKTLCTNCNSDAFKISPPWARGELLYGCSTCGTILDGVGNKVESEEGLKDIFRGTTLIEKTFPDIMELPSGVRSVMYARMLDYGFNMWMDGLKQGLLYGEIRNQRNDTIRRPQK